MKPSKLITTIISALKDIKAEDIDVIKSNEMTALFDYIVIASATSGRQTRALASNVQEKVRAAGGKVYGVEGEQTGEWMLVDLGDAIVHIMLPVTREYYNLEALWKNNVKTIAVENIHPLDTM